MPIKISQDETPSLNLTSMIDIVFLLIIFFMVGTQFTDVEHQMELTVPQVDDAAATESLVQHHVVNVFTDASITIDGELCDLGSLISRFEQEKSDGNRVHVLIRGDADGAFQNVATVLSACRKAGVDQMGVSVKLAQNN